MLYTLMTPTMKGGNTLKLDYAGEPFKLYPEQTVFVATDIEGVFTNVLEIKNIVTAPGRVVVVKSFEVEILSEQDLEGSDLFTSEENI